MSFDRINDRRDNGGIYAIVNMFRDKSALILGALLIGLSVWDVFFCEKKKIPVISTLLVITLLPFLVHSAFVVFGNSIWKIADMTDIVFELAFFAIGYGTRRLVSLLW